MTAVVIAALAILLFTSAAFWMDWWWYGSVGYRSLLVVRYLAQVVAFAIAAVAAAAFFAANWRYALQSAATEGATTAAGRNGSPLLRVPLWVVTVGVGVVAGVAAAATWQTWLLWLNGRGFGYTDPLFGRDAGFYVFALPALEALLRGALGLLGAAGVVVLLLYGLRLGLDRVGPRRAPPRMRNHVLAIAGGAALLIGAGFGLANFRLLYSTQGVVYGPGFTDAVIDRWANWLLALLSVAIAGLLLASGRVARWRLLLGSVAAWGIVAALVLAAVPAFVQQTLVAPSELSRERPYIAANIGATRAAFDLDGVEARELSGQGEPPPGSLAADSATFDNVRLWDYRVVQANFQAAQSFVPYYRFGDVDVDRYVVDGRLRQVLVSARELDVDGLAENAQSWPNRHLAYTHGYGAVVSPVSEAGPTGLPVYLAGRIPPEESGPFALDRPEVYFGELEGPWVAVNTGRAEVSGISSGEVAAPYAGAARGSVRLDSYPKRLLAAVALADRSVLLSSDLTQESRILLRRNIRERVGAIAPFLRLDDDPYPVFAGGRLIWVIDAYTETGRFPGATPRDGVNYARHSVKATVDAYDGTVIFYRTATADPIADAYGRAFGGLFTPIAEAPAEVAAHFRYPERFFDLQADVFATYHVTDPDEFYNGENRWAIAREEIEGDGAQRGDEQLQRMEAYYVTVAVPGEADVGFNLVLPFTPASRTNMTAWMAGRIDQAGSPILTLYQFPQQVSVPGPEQIDNRINTDPVISERITLLDAAGSRVILGNLLVIPVGETVLFAQPFYLRAATAENALTEFEYVILATSERTVLRPTLAEALAALAGGQGTAAAEAPPAAEGTTAGVPADGGRAEAVEALEVFERGQEALAEGDWAGYGQAQSELEAILRGLGEVVPVGPEVVGTPVP